MKNNKIKISFFVFFVCMLLCACSGNSNKDDLKDTMSTSVSKTESIQIDGICVDDSYEDKDGKPLKMLYLFYTLNANENNLEIDSKNTQMIIDDTNIYTSEIFPSTAIACKYASNYYYSGYIEDVYLDTSIKVIATFMVPEGDLVAGKTIKFKDTQIPEIESVNMSTDDIQRFATPQEMAKAIDPEGYASEILARDDADEDVQNTVMQSLNGYYWSFYVNNTAYEIEFGTPNIFELRTGLGTASQGTYTIKNGYVVCTYDETGYSVEIPYELKNGEIDLDFVEAFDIN